MAKFFSQLWTGGEYRWQRENADGRALRHAVSTRFSDRGVRPGDILYVWSFLTGRLFLIGRMEVDEIASSQRAAKRLDDPTINDSADHALARTCSRKQFGKEVPLETIRQLRFVSPDGEISLPKFRSNDEPDPQTFRGVRQLTAASAALLDGLLPPGPSEVR